MSATNVTYFGPTDETPSEILLEKMFIAGGYLTGVGFTVQFILYVQCMRILWKRRPHTTFSRFLMCFITVMLILSGAYCGITAWGIPLTYVDFRNYPGGPLGFILVEYSKQYTANACSVVIAYITSILADGILVWRCRVIYAASMNNKANYIMILPGLLYIASIGISIFSSIVNITPSNFFSLIAIHIDLTYFALSMALNIVITVMITTRLLLHQRQNQAVFGKRSASHYSSIWKMFMESAALYSILSILLLATFATNSPVQQLFLGLLPSVQSVSDYLIIYLLADGRAYNSTPTDKLTTVPGIEFRSRNGTTTFNDSTVLESKNSGAVKLQFMRSTTTSRATGGTEATQIESASEMKFQEEV